MSGGGANEGWHIMLLLCQCKKIEGLYSATLLSGDTVFSVVLSQTFLSFNPHNFSLSMILPVQDMGAYFFIQTLLSYQKTIMPQN